jgi:hypothetical protein
VDLARDALENILKVTGMTPQDVIMQQRGIAHRALEALGSSSPKSEDTQSAAGGAVLAALTECEEVLRLSEHPAFPDPLYHEEVKALGRRIGFGALMTTASAGWREVLAEQGYPAGGEFVAGPCFATLQSTLAQVRAALALSAASVSPGMETLQASECTKHGEGDQ